MSQFPLFAPTSLTVTDITRYLRELLDSDAVLSDVWVRGEVSNFSRPSSGHLYFTLKDSGAALRCVIWRSAALRIRFAIQNGIAVEAHGAISIYERDGQYQLYVDAVRPAGEGLLYREFLRLKNRLEAEGLFDEERKRPIPERPRRIGLVTSPTGAALQDMLNTLRGRYPLAEVILAPCAVQGDAAPEEIISALVGLQQAHPDVIIMARGGGSLEDLWAFNDEQVVRAIAACTVPIITGIGHETDFTLADFACDLRAPTPTGAAVMATPDRADIILELHSVQERLAGALFDYLSDERYHLNTARQRLERASPSTRIRSERQQLDEWQERGLRAMRSALQLRRAHLRGVHSRLLALNPAAILQRGYALLQKEDGTLLTSASRAVPGQVVQVKMWDGRLAARVEQIQLDHSPGIESSEGER
jgi:exodeoxyribonuclease VII large subunit